MKETEFGYVDERFRPNLLGIAQSTSEQEFLKSWKVPHIGLCAPLESRQFKAATWIGREETLFHESPVVAVATSVDKNITRDANDWFVGVSNFQWENGLLGNAESEIELAYRALQAALHGPATFTDALKLLESFMRTG